MSQEQEVPNLLHNGLATSTPQNSLAQPNEPTADSDSKSEATDATADSIVSAEIHGIKFKDWGFKIDRLFEVALRFYKRNESKAFHPTFDVRNQMNALILQAKYGNYNETKIPDVGLLDLVGKSRRKEWAQLRKCPELRRCRSSFAT